MNNSGSSGIGCLTALGLIFIVLKLIGTIHWSWWWVLSPFLIQVVVVIIVFAVLAVGAWIDTQAQK